jgi:hypothetical protein
VRAELTLTALQATFWMALIVVSAGAVLLLRGRRSAVPRVTDNTPGRADHSSAGADATLPLPVERD